MRVGDLVKFNWKNTPTGTGPDELGILLNVTQPKVLQKPIARVFWFRANSPLQHLAEVLEVVSESR